MPEPRMAGERCAAGPAFDASEVQVEAPNCGLCAGSSFQTVYSGCMETMYGLGGPSFNVDRCTDCGLVQTRPRPTPVSIARYYPDDYAGCERADGIRSSLRWVRSAFGVPHRLRYGPEEDPVPPRPRARILEIGAGTGVGLERMSKLGWETWAVEPSGQLAAEAVARGAVRSEHVQVVRAEGAELPADSFDLITLPHSLEHLHDPARVLEMVRGWLRPDGSLRISVPNFASAERRLFRRHWAGLDLPRHLFHFSPGTLTRLLERCGLRVERIHPQFQGSSLAASVQRLLPPSRGRPYSPSGAAYYLSLPAGWLLAGLGSSAFIRVDARTG